MADFFQPTAVVPQSSGLLANGATWPFPFDLGLWGPLVWAVGTVFGYLLFMTMNPLRGYLADSYDLLRERGHGRLVVIVAVLSLAGLTLDWWRQVPPGVAPEWGTFSVPELQPDPAQAVIGLVRPITAVFGVAVAGSELGFGPGAQNIVLTLACGLVGVAVAALGQFFLLLFLYLRVTMPGRTLKVGNLVDLSIRRIGALWPMFLGCWLFWSVPVAFGFGGWLRSGWAIAFSLVLVTFAFLEVSILGKNRPLAEAVGANFEAWRNRAGRTFWFLAVVCVHGLALFLVDSLLRGCVPAGTWFALGFTAIYGFVRAFVVVWLLGAWVILWTD